MEYSKSQETAVRHGEGPMLVLAGPGSGKTAVITGRVKYLIEAEKVNPENILVITFTKAAAIEMKERFTLLMGEDRGVRFSTFHSVFFLILRYSYGYGVDRIIKEEVSRAVLKEKIKELALEEQDEKDFIKNLLGEISQVKTEGIPLESFYSGICPAEAFREIFTCYANFMKQRGLIDFDDMMLLCDRLFKERPDILEAWRKKYTYILIDEFQDSSLLQFDLVRRLSEPENNLFVVGDDDQSIYRFRGARPEIMLGFPKLFPDCKQVMLKENYRSTKAITTFAGSIICENRTRFQKDIRPVNEEEDRKPEIKLYQDRRAEDTAIVKDILKTHEKGIPFSEMAIVYRTNLLSRPIVSKLMEYNIPFLMKEAVPDIYEHWIARNLFDYLRLAEGDRSPEVILKVMNRPNRFLSRESLASAVVSKAERPNFVSFLRWRDFYKGKAWMLDRLNELQFHLARMKGLLPFAAIHYLRNVVKYDDFLKEYAKERGIDAEELFEIIEELSEASKSFQSLADWEKQVESDREKRKENAKREKKEEGMKDAVVISTMHSCKGLEFYKVFIPEAVEGVIPYKKALKQADIEEERRLFYVAVTRAKKEIVISVPKKLYGKEKDPSPFIRKYLER